MRLAHDHRAVVGGNEARDPELVDQLGDAFVRNHHRELGLVPDALGRRDRELVIVAFPVGRSVVDANGLDGHADEIQVEAGEVLGRTRFDRGDACKHVGVRVVGELEAVVLDVVAAVAIEREIRIAHPVRSRRERDGRFRRREYERTQRDRDDKRQTPNHAPSNPGGRPLRAFHAPRRAPNRLTRSLSAQYSRGDSASPANFAHRFHVATGTSRRVPDVSGSGRRIEHTGGSRWPTTSSLPSGSALRCAAGTGSPSERCSVGSRSWSAATWRLA